MEAKGLHAMLHAITLNVIIFMVGLSTLFRMQWTIDRKIEQHCHGKLFHVNKH